MVVHLFIGLIIIALASLLITQGKRRRIWSILLLVALGIITFLFLQSINDQPSAGFIYQWLPYHQLRADFNISASLRMQEFLHSLIYLLVVIILFNIINLKENYSLQISILNLLSFTLLILLASSHDFFQLMFASSALSILCFYIPISLNARKHFLIYNFLAEFTAFTALSVSYGRIDTISIDALNDFASKGAHKDFICILLLFSLACKMGFFLLNSHYKSLSGESSNRLSSVYLLSQPLSGIIILSKLHPILTLTPWCEKVIVIWCLLTAAQGLIELCFCNSFNLKLGSFFQTVLSALFYFIYLQPTRLYSLTPNVLLLLLLCALCIYLATYNTQTKIIKSDNPRFNFINLVIGFLPLPIIFMTLPNDFFILSIIFVISYAISLKISCSPNAQKHFLSDNPPTHWILLYSMCMIIVCSSLIALNYRHFICNYYIIGIFIACLLLTPANLLSRIGENEIWQHNYLDAFYQNFLLMPLKIFGRMLWLTFDFIFIERGIIAAVVNVGKNILEHLHATQNNHLIFWLIYFGTGIIALIIYALGAHL